MNSLIKLMQGGCGPSMTVAVLCILVGVHASSCTTRFDPELKRKMSDKDSVIVLADTFLLTPTGEINLKKNRKIAASAASVAMEQLEDKGYCVSKPPLLFTAFMERTRDNYFGNGDISTQDESIMTRGPLYDTAALTPAQASALMSIFEKLPHLPARSAEQQHVFAEISKTGFEKETLSCFILVYGRDVYAFNQIMNLCATFGLVWQDEPLSVETAMIDNATGELIWKSTYHGSGVVGGITSKLNEGAINRQLCLFFRSIPSQDTP